jgi:hypothetical protein
VRHVPPPASERAALAAGRCGERMRAFVAWCLGRAGGTRRIREIAPAARASIKSRALRVELPP